jgi:DNA-binding transcriptional MerR regulator
MQEEKLFTVGEIAKRCGVSVRTLQFYDRIGLVSPGSRSEGGRRLYGWQDILRLHQALFLKSLGFSLDEIRDRLLPVQSVSGLADILRRQSDALGEQIRLLQKAEEMIKRAISEIGRSGDISITNLMAIMSAVQQGHSFAFVLKYFGREEIDRMVGDIMSRPDAEEMERRWQGMIDDLMALHGRGADPLGPEGQVFAARWWAMIEDISKNNPDFLKSALSAGADVDNWPDDAGNFKAAIRDFVGIAINKYVGDKGIRLPT